MTRTLSEHESIALVARYGVPIAEERRAATPDGAVDAADTLGYPVVVKLHGGAIAHKTERGLVRLGVADATSVRARLPSSSRSRPPPTATSISSSRR